ncbi:DNA-binding protein [Oceanobacillus picturae]|uniref:DNA-binding protein n=1 Tax=Oceanobacillus picturae TaxID=171693 RepID=A0A0U9H653_9BACI|nr:hypothetical protein [Oceanobacillus picturae]GAQ17867.1 DNA-binding protein [Oceanobacillus picturae]
MIYIEKNRKESGFVKIDNQTVQKDLNDLAAIGLLTHILSHSPTWRIRKSELHKQFTRRKVDSSWKVLLEHRYIMGFFCHVDGHHEYFYKAADHPFSQSDFETFVGEQKKELEEKGLAVFNIKAIKDSPLDVPDFFSNLQNVQCKPDSAKSATKNEKKTKEIHTKKHSLATVNKPANKADQIINIANEFYADFAAGRWAKEKWHQIIEKYAREFVANDRYVPDNKLKAYVYGSLKKIAEHHDYKNSEEYAEYKRVVKEMFVDHGVEIHESITMQ